jgi:hypothetical protein
MPSIDVVLMRLAILLGWDVRPRDELRDEKGLEQGLVAAAKEEAGDPHLATIPPGRWVPFA